MTTSHRQGEWYSRCWWCSRQHPPPAAAAPPPCVQSKLRSEEQSSLPAAAPWVSSQQPQVPCQQSQQQLFGLPTCPGVKIKKARRYAAKYWVQCYHSARSAALQVGAWRCYWGAKYGAISRVGALGAMIGDVRRGVRDGVNGTTNTRTTLSHLH
jgi:hypothetical protein